MARQASKLGPLPHEASARPQRASPARRSPDAEGAASSSRKAASKPVAGLVLRKSPARLKLEVLEQGHERLLRDIEKRKLACEATERTVRDAQDAVHARAEPLRATLLSMLREIHQIFDELLDPKSPLSRTHRAALRRFYREQLDGLPRPDAEDPPTGDRDGEPRDSSGGRSAPFDGGWPGAPNDVEHASAAKPTAANTSSLRTLYRKLAVALHPDKARDASETARLTSLMKEVTRAYADQDLAKLVEIERTWLAQSPIGDSDEDLEGPTARLLEANGELRRQLRALTARLKELEQSLPGVSWPKRRGSASGAELAAGLISEIEGEVKDIERLRDAARNLLQGRVTVPEFLMGPRLPADESGDPLSELFEELLEEMLDGARQQGRRARPSSRPSSHRGPRQR